jgi:hypothetical protein
MKRAPDWTLDEFETLLNSPSLSEENLRLKLPRRTIDAIQIVRQGIHAYHTGKDYSVLSKIMVNRLEKNAGEVVCPICSKSLKVA